MAILNLPDEIGIDHLVSTSGLIEILKDEHQHAGDDHPKQ